MEPRLNSLSFSSVGFRVYKSVSLGKGIRLGISRSGVGISAGIPGARYSVHSSGRTTKTVGLPGSGVSYREVSHPTKAARARRADSVAPQVSMYPKAGLFAPREEKLFVTAITSYMRGRHDEALASLQDVQQRDSQDRHTSEEFFIGLCLVALGRLQDAVAPFEAVIASDQQIPDALMQKYGIGGLLQIEITPSVTADMPMSNLSVALMLAEVYQRCGQAEGAIELLESLGALSPTPAFGLSLAELYLEQEQWQNVMRVTEGFETNEDDLTAQLLAIRAKALDELGMPEAALTIAKEALRFKKRRPETLRFARYIRAGSYEQLGRRAQARMELERIYAEDATYADVATRLGVEATIASSPPRPDV